MTGAPADRRIRVLLVDDHPIVLEGVHRIVASHPDLAVVGVAGSVGEVLAVRDAAIDVCLLDVALPDGDGLTNLPALRRHLPRTAFVMLTMQPESTYAARCLEAGALGFVPKGSAPVEIVRAIRAAAAGRRYVSPAVGATMAARERGAPRLSPRELEVLRLLATGETVTEIANRLHLSVKTVSTFKTRVHFKLGVRSFADLVRAADRMGLVGAPSGLATDPDGLTPEPAS